MLRFCFIDTLILVGSDLGMLRLRCLNIARFSAAFFSVNLASVFLYTDIFYQSEQGGVGRRRSATLPYLF